MPCISQVIHALGLMFTAGTARILAEYLDESRKLVCFYACAQLIRELNLKLLPRSALNPASARIRVTIRKGNVGLDIQNRRTIAQVSASHVYDRAVRRDFHTLKLYARKSNGIGPKGTTRGKHAHTLGTSKARRAHHWRPVVIYFRAFLHSRICCNVSSRTAGHPVLKLPEQPQM